MSPHLFFCLPPSEIAAADLKIDANSNLAAFLGDPKFPHTIMSAGRGERIIRLQDLYKTYSGLEFTRAHDRPIAMDGIYSRLLKAFDAKGGYGMFDQGEQNLGLLRRILLWYRPDDTPTLDRIQFPQGQAVPPSWSLMAYMGRIDFLWLKFDGIEWKSLRSPWCEKRGPTDSGDMALRGRVRDIIAGFAGTEDEGKLQFDIPSEQPSNRIGMQCVVLGVEHDRVPPRALADRRHYFLIVRPIETQYLMQLGGSRVYERVGAGYLPGRFVTPERDEVQIL